MTVEEFKNYIEENQNSDEFKKLMEWIGIDCDQNIFETIIEYLKHNHAKIDTIDFFVPDFDHFYNFFECYKKKTFEMAHIDTGEINLSETPYLKQRKKNATGYFTDGYIILPDESMYILKYPLHYKYGKSGVRDCACQYASIIASGIANLLGIDTSENFLFVMPNGQDRLGSKFFLKPNEELVSFYDHWKIESISGILNELRNTLWLRKCPNEKINEIEFEFLKQEFLAKLIDLDDQAADNSGLIVSTSGEGTKRSIRMVPMFDYDFSFMFSEHSTIMRRKCDNGQTDISSFIKQYKDYPGFMDFVRRSISILDMNKVYDNIYEKSGLQIFSEQLEDPILLEYSEFVNRNLKLAKKTVKELDENAREEL